MKMRSVAVIGAGIGGLVTVKSLLEEGLNVVCFEESSDIGGLWSFKEQVQDHPTVMSCTVMNTSKEMSAFSDFPPPAHFSNFMHHKQALEYIKLYAERFALKRHIRFQHLVESVRPSDNHSDSGRWTVQVLDTTSGTKTVDTFDAVTVCSGKQARPHWPRFPGLSEFKGPVIHSKDYKSPEIFRNRTVLVIGIGNSGADIAVELSGIANKVYMSTRNGAWIFSRLAQGGYPADLLIFRRCMDYLKRLIPYSWVCTYVEHQLSKRLNHDLYDLRPPYRALSHYPTLSDDLHLKIASGLVQLKGDVQWFEQTGVAFLNEESVPIDAVILATGYEENFPFLNEEFNPLNNGKVELFKYVFPLNSKHTTMAFVGMLYAFGPQFPVVEMQARWIARVFAGQCPLPSSQEMTSVVLANEERMRRRFKSCSRLSAQMDWISYLDEMACYIGARPSLWTLFWQDPRLFFRCLLGPALPYMYRLNGPNSWKEARKAIMGARERIVTPFKHKKITPKL